MNIEIGIMKCIRVVVLAAFFVGMGTAGCSRTNSEQPNREENARPMALVGEWNAVQQGEGNLQGFDVRILLPRDGDGRFEFRVNGMPADFAVGDWQMMGNYLIIERSDNDGFAAFRLKALLDQELEIVNRSGDPLILHRME